MKEVTFFLTACDRPDLLKRTLESFIKFNTYPLKEVIIIEDSGKTGINDFAYEIFKDIPLKIIYNEQNLGMIQSTLKGIKEIKTDLVFHCEDDWCFTNTGFIEASLHILEKDPMITSVSLLNYKKNKDLIAERKDEYYYAKINNKVGGYTSNPSLRYLKIYEPYNNFQTEGDISMYYINKGMRIAFTMNSNGYVGHTGNRRSMYRKNSDNNKV